MTDRLSPRELDAAAVKMKEGQERLFALGLVSVAYHRRLFSPIVKQEQLHNVSAALVESLVNHYPTLLLCDPDPLFGALELAMIVGMLAGRCHADAIPPGLASLVQPMAEARL